MRRLLIVLLACAVMPLQPAAETTKIPPCPGGRPPPPPRMTEAEQKAAATKAKAAAEKADAQPTSYVVTTCRPSNMPMPTPSRPQLRLASQPSLKEKRAASLDYVAIGLKCDPVGQQQACNRYAKTPGFGPSKPIGCRSFKTVGELKDYLKSHRFGGLGGKAVMCETRLGKEKYAERIGACCLEMAQDACMVAGDPIADPLSCHSFTDDPSLNKFLEENGKFNGMECKLKVGGTAFRALVPVCSKPVAAAVCKPDSAILKGCTFISRDPKVLADWSKEFVNKAMETCKIEKTGTEFRKPARDCDADTQKSACPIGSKPVACKVYASVKDIGVSYAGI